MFNLKLKTFALYWLFNPLPPSQVPASHGAAVRGGGPAPDARAGRAAVPGACREEAQGGERETAALSRPFYQV